MNSELSTTKGRTEIKEDGFELLEYARFGYEVWKEGAMEFVRVGKDSELVKTEAGGRIVSRGLVLIAE